MKANLQRKLTVPLLATVSVLAACSSFTAKNDCPNGDKSDPKCSSGPAVGASPASAPVTR